MAQVKPPTSAQQRDAIVAIAPPWLQNQSPPLNGAPLGVGGRYLYDIGLGDDCLLEKMNQAMQAHMPTVCTPTALPYIGNDRLLTQGPNETTAEFRIRLQQAFQTWQLAGERIAVMRIVGSFMGSLLQSLNDNPVMAIVGGYHARQWSTYYVADVANNFENPPSLVRETSTNFDWDGLGGIRWWRNWLVFYYEKIALSISGTAASIGSPTGAFYPLTGLSGATGDTSQAFTSYVTISGAANAGNNGIFQITDINSATEVTYANPNGVYPDANSGSITWSLSNFPAFAPAPVWGAPGVVWGGNTNQCYGLQLVGTANSVNTSAFLTTLRGLISLWKSANTFYQNIIFTFYGGNGTNNHEFSPNSTESTGNPNGTWGSGSTISTQDAYGNAVPVAEGGTAYVASYNTGINNQLSAMVAVTDGTAIYQQCTTPTGC